MANRPEIHDKFIEVILDGPQDSDAVHQLIKLNDVAISRFISEGKPLMLLINLTDVGRLTAGAFTAGIDTMDEHTFPFQKMAIYGIKTSIIREMIDLMIKTFADRYTMAVFKTRQEAIDWLLKPSD